MLHLVHRTHTRDHFFVGSRNRKNERTANPIMVDLNVEFPASAVRTIFILQMHCSAARIKINCLALTCANFRTNGQRLDDFRPEKIKKSIFVHFAYKTSNSTSQRRNSVRISINFHFHSIIITSLRIML